MGWTLPWYSSHGSDFNYDFDVSHDESVAPVRYNYADKAELVQKGEDYFVTGESHGSAPSCATATPYSTRTRRTRAVATCWWGRTTCWT